MSRPMLMGAVGRGPELGNAAAAGGKLQLMQSPTWQRVPLSDNAFGLGGARSPGNLSRKLAKTAGGTQRRSASAGSIEVAEVRALCKDEPHSEGEPSTQSDHGNLMQRLKSREARGKGESNRDFLAAYRAASVPPVASDNRLDELIRNTAQRADELRVRSDELQVETADAERRLERANLQNVQRAAESELTALNPFERSQRRIQEDKREEELQRQRDEAQANYLKVHRRLQSELIELRDFKVLLREFRRLRLEKLQEALGRVRDGRKLRACVREMIRHGAQRILQRLETFNVPLEPWMREVLVNSCHLELRIENAEGKLLDLRRQALSAVKGDIQGMLTQTKQERFETLCARTWDNRLLGRDDASARRPTTQASSGEGPPRRACSFDLPAAGGAGSEEDGGGVSLAGTNDSRQSAGGTKFAMRISENAAAEMHAVEADIAAVRRLLVDMRHNAASVICHRIREAEKSGGRESAREASEWGWRMLTLLVSEDFAKAAMKEFHKSAPQGKFVV